MPSKNNKAEEPGISESDRAAALEHALADLQESRHRAWLWSSLGRFVKWALASIAAITVVADAAIRVMKALGK